MLTLKKMQRFTPVDKFARTPAHSTGLHDYEL
jgi:hypothetical protein